MGAGNRGGVHRKRHSAVAGAALAYALLALVMTWPVGLALGRVLPSDLGDPVLNCWILARNGQWLLDLLAGRPVGDFWDARIFHPAPLTLAYSEHLAPQSLQALPLYASTGNIVLAYNVLLLSTFFLSAFGVFLLVRDLTGHVPAAFLAGLFYGFTPYRIDQIPHLQVLSSQWMPFALLGLRRFIAGGRGGPLVGGVLALVAQNLSCGYYVFYFLPFATLYALVELAKHARHREPGRILGLVLAAAAVAGLALPFLLPYHAIHTQGLLVRERAEVDRFSADVLSSLTAPEGLWLWGDRLRAHRRPGAEGTLFLGFVPLALAAVAVAAAARRAREGLPPPPDTRTGLERGSRLARLALWPRVRFFLRSAAASETVFFLVAAALAWILALGPTIRVHGQEILRPGPYTLLHEHVPGFAGLRVPARLTMIVALFLAILAGKGAASLLGRTRRVLTLAAAVGLLFLVEAAAFPLQIHPVAADPALRPLVAKDAPAVYRHVAELAPDSVLAEMPVHSDPEELRSMVPALQHRRRLVNGYSGLGPPGYVPLRPTLLLAAPEKVWAALRAAGATHVVVHQGAWSIPRKGRRVTQSLEARGARLLATEGTDVLLALPTKSSIRR